MTSGKVLEEFILQNTPTKLGNKLINTVGSIVKR